MTTFPEIHPEKCPFCDGQLQLVKAKYVWDYAYKCELSHDQGRVFPKRGVAAHPL